MVQNLELTVLQPSLHGHALSNLSLVTLILHAYASIMYALHSNIIMQLLSSLRYMHA